MRLYEITNEYVEVFDKLSEIENLDSEILENTLSPIQQDINKKSINVAAYIKNLEAEQSMMEEYIKKMMNKKKSYQIKIDSIKDYLRFNMEKCGISKISSPEFNINLSGDDIRTDIYDMSLLPINYCRKIEKFEPDKNKIKEAIESGEVVEGARLIKTKRLTIR